MIFDPDSEGFSALCPLRDGFIYNILSMGLENDHFLKITGFYLLQDGYTHTPIRVCICALHTYLDMLSGTYVHAVDVCTQSCNRLPSRRPTRPCCNRPRCTDVAEGFPDRHAEPRGCTSCQQFLEVFRILIAYL